MLEQTKHTETLHSFWPKDVTRLESDLYQQLINWSPGWQFVEMKGGKGKGVIYGKLTDWVGYLHQCFHLSIIPFCHDLPSTITNIQLASDAPAVSIIFLTCILHFKPSRIHPYIYLNTQQICAPSVCICKQACHFLPGMIDCTRGRFSDWSPWVRVEQYSKSMMRYSNLCLWHCCCCFHPQTSSSLFCHLPKSCGWKLV